MEDVLCVYQQPYNPAYPQVCVDETTKQLVASTRETVPMQPGKAMRQILNMSAKGRVACSWPVNR